LKWRKRNKGAIEWVEIEPADYRVILKFKGGDSFSVTYPMGYPKKGETFFVYSEADSLSEFNDNIIEQVELAEKFDDVLSACVAVYSGDGGDFDFKDFVDDDEGLNDSFEGFKAEPKVNTKFDRVDEEFANKKFLEIGSPSASLRLLKDLKSIKKGNPDALGFSAEPRIEPGKNIENLYHWIVKLKFPGCELGRDLEKAEKEYGIDYVELEMRFSKDYPFQPPFVRVVRPRFVFHTGHVTIGGSICMELLTNSGWASTNDIESILIQIRAEMQGGGARIQFGNQREYSENEAWEAFYRAAKGHGWDIKDIGPTMFPLVK
jgi:ubiquitin-conjugating enzyme E2 Q